MKETSTNAENAAFIKSSCPMSYAMSMLNGRWKILLLWYIYLGLNRFSLIKKQLPKLTTKMLSQQLKELERDGLLQKTIYPEMPPRVEYAITPKTESLIPVLTALNQWGKREMANRVIKD
jgi:DNA-binding HxlR family transcriptional regulator